MCFIFLTSLSPLLLDSALENFPINMSHSYFSGRDSATQNLGFDHPLLKSSETANGSNHFNNISLKEEAKDGMMMNDHNINPNDSNDDLSDLNDLGSEDSENSMDATPLINGQGDLSNGNAVDVMPMKMEPLTSLS